MSEEREDLILEEEDDESGEPAEAGTQYESKSKAIRKHCMECCLSQEAEVRGCTCVSCPLHPFRLTIAIKEEQVESRAKAIRRTCLDCVGGNSNDVKNCEFTNCHLYPYRFGKNPK